MSGNQVATLVEMAIPTGPDVSVLQGMQDPIVMVYRIIQRGGNKRESQLVINGLSPTGKTTSAKVKEILKLQEQVGDVAKWADGGPGLYRFEVTDQQSTAKSVWETRIGSRAGEEIGEASAPAGNVAPSVPPPPSSDNINLGNGYYYNTNLQILTDRFGRIHKWTPDRPLPDSLILSSGQITPTSNSAQSTPIGTSLLGGLGNSPEVEALRARLEAVTSELNRSKEESREEIRRREIQELRDSHQRQIEEVTSRFEKLFERLSAKPAEDPQVAELRRQLAERERTDALRAEVNSKIDSLASLVREAQTNRGPDPMITTLTGLLGQQASMFTEQMRNLRESTQQTALTPERYVELMRHQIELGDKSGISEKMLTMMNSLLDSALRFRQAESEIGSSGHGGIDWMRVIEALTSRVSDAFSAYAQVKSREAAAETARRNAEVVHTRAQMVREQQAAEVAKLKAVPAIPPPAAPASEDPEAAREALAEKMFGPKPTMTSSTPTVETASVAAEAPAPIAAVVPPSPATPAPAPKAGKGSPLKRASLADLRKHYGKMSDEDFFGSALQFIVQLREVFTTNPDQLTADDVAEAIMQARPQIVEGVKAAGVAPPAVAMLGHGQYSYLFERMLPEQGEVFWAAAATALKAKVEAERTAAGR